MKRGETLLSFGSTGFAGDTGFVCNNLRFSIKSLWEAHYISIN